MRPFVRRGLRTAGYLSLANAVIALIGVAFRWPLIDTLGLLSLLEGIALMLVAAFIELGRSLSFRLSRERILGVKHPASQEALAGHREGAQSALVGGAVLMVVAFVLALPYI